MVVASAIIYGVFEGSCLVFSVVYQLRNVRRSNGMLIMLKCVIVAKKRCHMP